MSKKFYLIVLVALNLVAFASSESLAGDRCEGRNVTPRGKHLDCEIEDNTINCWTERAWVVDNSGEGEQLEGYCDVDIEPVGEVKGLFVHNSRYNGLERSFACILDREGIKCFGAGKDKVKALPDTLSVSDPIAMLPDRYSDRVCVLGKKDLKCLEHPTSLVKHNEHRLPGDNLSLHWIGSTPCIQHGLQVTCFSKSLQETFDLDEFFQPHGVLNVEEISVSEFDWETTDADGKPRSEAAVRIEVVDSGYGFKRKLIREAPRSNLRRLDFDGSERAEWGISLLNADEGAFVEVREFDVPGFQGKKYSCGLNRDQWVCWGDYAHRVPTLSKEEGPVRSFFELRQKGTFGSDPFICWVTESAGTKCEYIFYGGAGLPQPSFFPRTLSDVSVNHEKNEVCFSDQDTSVTRRVCWRPPISEGSEHSVDVFFADLSGFQDISGSPKKGCGRYRGIIRCWGEELVHFEPLPFPDSENYFKWSDRFQNLEYTDIEFFDGHGCFLTKKEGRVCWGLHGRRIEGAVPIAQKIDSLLSAGDHGFCYLSSEIVSCGGKYIPADSWELNGLDHVESLRSTISNSSEDPVNQFCAIQVLGEIEREVCVISKTRRLSSVQLLNPSLDEIVETLKGPHFTCGTYDSRTVCWDTDPFNRERDPYRGGNLVRFIPFELDPEIRLFSNPRQDTVCSLIENKADCWAVSGRYKAKNYQVQFDIEVETLSTFGPQYSATGTCTLGLDKENGELQTQCYGLPGDSALLNFPDALGINEHGACVTYNEEMKKMEPCYGRYRYLYDPAQVPRNGLALALLRETSFFYSHDEALLKDMVSILRFGTASKNYETLYLLFHSALKRELLADDDEYYRLLFAPELKMNVPLGPYSLESSADKKERTALLQVLLSVIKTSLPLLNDQEREAASQLMTELAKYISDSSTIIPESVYEGLRVYLASSIENQYLRSRTDLVSQIISSLEQGQE